jgi:transposase InsO family protein
LTKLPAASTITAILRRHGLLREDDSEKAKAYQRFEKERPNQLWQMDFKGDFALGTGARCYPLTVIDDHSRFAVALQACPNQQRETVQDHLTEAFRRYGLPERIITDHGAPWGVGMARPDGGVFYTRLSAWLMRLGLRVSFTARAHPQTNGKNERFNRTLQAEVPAL